MNGDVNKGSFLGNRLLIAISLMVTLIGIGTGVYYLRYGYTFIDAFYMTIITVATVGFGEVNPLDNEGKIFTSFLILISIFIFAYAVTSVSAYLVSINSVFKYNLRKMEKAINELQGHVIICGYGRNGRQAANKLKNFNRNFVVIENNENILKELTENGLLFVEGNATDDDTLMKAGIRNASHLITTLPADTDNVFISLTSRQMNPGIHIVSRASDESSIRKLRIAGADNIIMPDKVGGDHMASLIVAPDLIEFFDNLSVTTHGAMNVREVLIKNLPEAKILNDLDIKPLTGCTIIGYKSSSGEYTINPEHDLKVTPDGKIIVLGNKEQIKKFNSVFNFS